MKLDFSTKDWSNAVVELLNSVKIDVQHDIPYLAGYSIDWSAGNRTVYIDRHCPLAAVMNNIPVVIYVLLVVHEAVEKSMAYANGLPYAEAHAMATVAEMREAVSQGIHWNAYESYMQKFIKGADAEKLQCVPADLDLEPYRDSKDYEKLKEIAEAHKCSGCPHIANVRNVHAN